MDGHSQDKFNEKDYQKKDRKTDKKKNRVQRPTFTPKQQKNHYTSVSVSDEGETSSQRGLAAKKKFRLLKNAIQLQQYLANNGV